jgi:hypothetical protein
MATPQQQPKQPAKAPIVVSLATVKRGKVDSPSRITIYGVEGIGKSSFAAGAPGVLFLDAEKGTTKLDVARVDVDDWPHLLAWVEQLTNSEHEYKTVALDTLDAIEQMCWRHLCETRMWDGIEKPGFGKGYVAALEQWRDLIARLERMQSKRGLNVIFTAHALIKPFKNPEGDDYERYTMRLNDKAAGLLKGWCETVLFAQYETFAVKDEDTKRIRGVSSGDRLIRTERTAAWDAKNRDNLPPSLPLDWQAFAEAVAGGANPEKLRARIAELVATLTPEKRAKVEAAVASKPDNAAFLTHVMGKIQTEIHLSNQEQGQ